MSDLQFSEMNVNRPSLADVTASYNTLFSAIEANNDLTEVVKSWDNIRNKLNTYSSITHLRFSQDTTNETFKAEREFSDEISPKFTELAVAMKRKLIENKDTLVAEYGQHAFDLWATDILTYEPVIQDDLVLESKEVADYMEGKAKAKIQCFGETFNLSTIVKFESEANREKRHMAAKAQWQWYADNSAANGQHYDKLVKLRTKMAQKLGHENYVKLGYQRMQRIDYNATDVKHFRNQVIKNVVPLVSKLKEEQRSKLGVEKLMVWDSVPDLRGAPKPNGDPKTLTESAKKMFDGMHPELGDFFRLMDNRNLLDLDSRDGKSGGGFCTSFPIYGVPFVFANFNGTKHDVEVFTHEIGHAFQNYLAQSQNISDYYWPTMESAEIHSMSLEYLTWPHMEKFFGDDADRFRKVHLTGALSFMPYGCAVDHFQHEIYENPEMTPTERNATWKKMEELYLPWLDWGDIEHGANGGRWHAQSHIFMGPFYYIDYVLALTCALQFWNDSQSDYDAAIERYVKLCRRGGEAPFQELAKSAGLKSPFEDGCLVSVVERANAFLK